MVYDWVYQLALPAKHHGLSNQNLSNVFNVVNSIMIIIIYNYHISLLLSTSVVTACHPHKYYVFKPLQILHHDSEFSSLGCDKSQDRTQIMFGSPPGFSAFSKWRPTGHLFGIFVKGHVGNVAQVEVFRFLRELDASSDAMFANLPFVQNG